MSDERPSKWAECDAIVRDLGDLQAQIAALETSAILAAPELERVRAIVAGAADAVAATVARAAEDDDPRFAATRSQITRARQALAAVAAT